MPAASISEYILKVVRGVRSSCVTAETKAPRRSLNDTAPFSSRATALAANRTQHHAMTNENRMGDQKGRGSTATAPVSRRAGRAANRRGSLSLADKETACKLADGNRSFTSIKRESRSLSQSSQHP